MPAAGNYIIVKWEKGWGCSLKAKKAKNFLPAAGTYIIVSWKKSWGCPFKAKKRPKIFCLRQPLKTLWTEREAEGALSKQKRPKSFCLRQAIILLWNERKAEGALSKSQEKSWPKLHKCLLSKRCLLNYGVEGGIPPLSLKSDTLPPQGPKAHPLLEAGRLVYCALLEHLLSATDQVQSSFILVFYSHNWPESLVLNLSFEIKLIWS